METPTVMPKGPYNPLASLSDIAASLPRQPASATPPPVNSTQPGAGGVAGKPSLAKHRRMSSAGQARRRLSDATAATLTNAVISRIAPPATALSSGVGIAPTHSRSTPSSTTTSSAPSAPASTSQDLGFDFEGLDLPGGTVIEVLAEPPPSIQTLKKKGQNVFRCESCAKVYRHPSCLVKHRWEHSPHWHEASKFLLSKHQQVQLLEAAAILSHIAPPVAVPVVEATKEEPLPSATTSDATPDTVTDTPPPVTDRITTRNASARRNSSATSPLSSLSSSRPMASSLSTSATSAAKDGKSSDPFENTASLSMGTSLPEDRSLWPFFVSRGATVVSLGSGASSGSPSLGGAMPVRVTRREAVKAESDEEDMETTQDQEDELASVAETGLEMEMGDVFEDDELEGEADVVSTLSSERDSGYASSGRAVAGAAAKGSPPSVSVSVSVSPSSELLEPSTGPIRATRARSSSTSLSVSGPGVMRPRSSSISTSASASSRSRSSRHGHSRSLSSAKVLDGSVQEEGEAEEGMRTRARSRSSAAAPVSSSASMNRASSKSKGSSGLGASRPARLSSTASVDNDDDSPPPPSSFHPYGSYRSSTSASTSVSISTRGHSRARSYSNTSTSVSTPLVSVSVGGVAIIDSSGPYRAPSMGHHRHSSFGAGTPSSAASSLSHSFGGGYAHSLSRGMGGLGISAPRSNIRSLEEEEEEEEVDELEERIDLDPIPRAREKAERDDDQETVDGSWDGEDVQAGGMAMDMDL